MLALTSRYAGTSSITSVETSAFGWLRGVVCDHNREDMPRLGVEHPAFRLSRSEANHSGANMADNQLPSGTDQVILRRSIETRGRRS
jgi:hypothetical protein